MIQGSPPLVPWEVNCLIVYNSQCFTMYDAAICCLMTGGLLQPSFRKVSICLTPSQYYHSPGMYHMKHVYSIQVKETLVNQTRQSYKCGQQDHDQNFQKNNRSSPSWANKHIQPPNDRLGCFTQSLSMSFVSVTQRAGHPSCGVPDLLLGVFERLCGAFRDMKGLRYEGTHQRASRMTHKRCRFGHEEEEALVGKNLQRRPIPESLPVLDTYSVRPIGRHIT